jgi:Predicted glycosyltransferases
MPDPVRNATAAGVVAFAPEADLILPLVTSVLRDVEHVLVFVNAVIDDDLARQLTDVDPRCELIRSDVNLGVAEALNILALNAILKGCRRLILFDQDSRPPAGMVAALEEAMDRLSATDERIAVIGPRIVAPKGEAERYKSPRYFPQPDRQARDGAVPVRYIITSGSLLNLAAFRAVGAFRSDFFIDAIDTEWCFRAWSKGYSCWFVADLPMEHTIGEGMVRSRLFRIRFPRQSQMRMYCYFRNQAACLGLAHIPIGWRARFALHMTRLAASTLAISRFSLPTLRLIAGAVMDGLKGRLGPPPGAVRSATLPILAQSVMATGESSPGTGP